MVCTLSGQTGNLGDEQHSVFERPASEGVRDRYNGLFKYPKWRDHAARMLQII